MDYACSTVFLLKGIRRSSPHCNFGCYMAARFRRIPRLLAAKDGRSMQGAKSLTVSIRNANESYSGVHENVG